jgi:ElaB/YqjD/DUF883 family membrane-anchored ribosome-binding protein
MCFLVRGCGIFPQGCRTAKEVYRVAILVSSNRRSNMPAKSATAAAAETTTDAAAQAERRFSEAARKFEKVVAEGLEQIRAQSRTYADSTAEHLDGAQRYLAERVREKPLISAGTALGIGLLLGLLLGSGRNR